MSDCFVTSCTISCQAPLFLGFSRQEHWSNLSFSSPGDLSDPGIEPMFPVSPALQADSLPTEPSGKPQYYSAKLVQAPLLGSPSMRPIPIPPKAYTRGDTGV